MDLIRVGAFELYPSERTLSHAGRPLELGARAFDLLLVLVEQPGRLVTKATLLDRVWPQLVVDENNLPTQIASLRRVLGADAIRTVPGFGYRLELPVSAGAAVAAETPPSGEPEDTPPRLSVPRRLWPQRLSPLIARDEDLRALESALTRSSLVTVVGVPGVGKTRLAQEILVRAAAEPNAAVAWVSLGSIVALQHVPPAIALAAGLSLAEGVDGFVALRQALREAPLLLILDCAEHIAEALAAPLGELIATTQSLRVLVTSQAPLGVPGEIVYRLAVLPVPDAGFAPLEAWSFGSVALFVQRAAAADRRFELTAGNTALVAEICRRLDGIPLALELAAARVPALGLAALLERLDDRFRLLKMPGQSADPRHGALHAAFDWSYGLLPPAEQRVFNRLGAFAGSFSLKVAAACVADESIDGAEAIDLIGRLVDRSLVTVLAADPPRYVLLETARHYAIGRLAAEGALAVARARMAEAMLAVLDSAYEEYWSLDEAVWLHRYAPEIDNVRAAMEWAMSGSPALGVALFGSAWPLFVETDLHAEGRDRYMQTLEHLSDKLPRARVGRFWEAIASYDASRQWGRARYAAELAAAAHAEVGDVRAQYYALTQLTSSWRVDTPDAHVALAAARQLENPAWPARLLAHGAMTEGALLMSAGEFASARASYQRAVRFALTTSERLALAATVSVVELDIACGDMAAALQLGRALLLSVPHLGRRETHLELLATTFCALLLAGELDEARAIGAELYELAAPLENNKLCMALDGMAYLTCEERRYQEAARIAACADAAHDAQGQARRRPAQERVRTAVLSALDKGLGEAWHDSLQPRERLDERGACALALGRRP